MRLSGWSPRSLSVLHTLGLKGPVSPVWSPLLQIHFARIFICADPRRILVCFNTVNMGSSELEVTAKDVQAGDGKLNDEGIQLQTVPVAEGTCTPTEETGEVSLWAAIRTYKQAVFWSVFFCISALMWGYDVLVSPLEPQAHHHSKLPVAINHHHFNPGLPTRLWVSLPR